MTSIKYFYSELNQIRELFHKYGKFDDANAKLDEIAKYIALYVYQIQNGEKTIVETLKIYEQNNGFNLVKSLKEQFSKIIKVGDIFTKQSILNIGDEDNQFAYTLLKMVVNSVDGFFKYSKDFDLLNECFGHFVRDNFRNNIEDAQYMTPQEAVNLMCDIALFDLAEQNSLDDFVVMDPCCGVGSFLSTFYQRNMVINRDKLVLIGQDKVERMVRLSKINLFLANIHNQQISNGNSLVGESILNRHLGKVDLILTNPPFGAKFNSAELKESAKLNYPLLHDIIFKNGSNFSSEILFIDRCLQLLKPNGKLLIVVPDSVISSAGLANTLRFRLSHSSSLNIKAIIELPAVTFAQAGTRTKTSILYIVKGRNRIQFTFMAKCESIGFEVSTKKGATIKNSQGENELLKIFESYKVAIPAFEVNSEEQVITKEPSSVLVKSDLLKSNSWTAGHYNAEKIEALKALRNKDCKLVRLSDIATFETKIRKREIIPTESKCISVLHIVNGDNLNFEDLLIYDPKYKGIVCRPGDLLFSKINPRITRVLIVPNLAFPMTCSSEFEIINAKKEINNYALKLLLMLPYVQIQINATTSGTSSSHNRIKSQDLANILIPLPKEGTVMYSDFINKAILFEQQDKMSNNLRFDMYKLKNEAFDLFS